MSIIAQHSEYVNYQGVALNQSGDPMANENLTLILSIRFGTPTTAPTYVETFSVGTNADGVFSVKIGGGTPLSGTYSSLEWGAMAAYITVNINGTEIGTTEINAVPYAMSSGKALAMSINDLTDTSGSPAPGEVLTFDGSGWVPTVVPSTSPWQIDGSDINYTAGKVGIGVSQPDSGSRLHVGGDLYVQSNLGAFLLGYPNGGNMWRLATLSSGAHLLFRSRPSGSTVFTSRFAMEQDGYFGVNTGNPQARVQINQDGQTVGLGLRFEDGTANSEWDITHGFGLRFHYGGVLKGVISANTGAYIQSSMRVMKENIYPLNSVLSKVSQLEPSTYNYKDDNFKSRTIGFVAEDAIELFPELVVSIEADNALGIDYAGFSVVALKAIQEQQEMIEKLEKRIADLEAKLD